MSPLAAIEPRPAELAEALPASEDARLRGPPRARPRAGEAADRAAAARSWYAAHARPWVAARRVALAYLGREQVALETGHVFRSRELAGRLLAGEAHGLLALAVTAGAEVDAESQRLWDAGRPDEAYFLDRLGAAIAEHLVGWASVWYCREAALGGETVLGHLSPGCGDWDLREQARLAEAVGLGSGPLRMLDSGMLLPKNSLLAARGLSHAAGVASPEDACRSCDLTPCRFRRAAYAGAA